MEEWFLLGKREREIKKIRLYTYEIDKIVVYFRFLIFFFLLLFVFRIHIDRQIRFEEQQSGIIIGARGTISFHFWKKYLNNVCSDGTIFFIWRSKKAILEKKRREKKKESNHLVTRTDLAPLRNFVIPFRFDHGHGEKRGFCVTFRR